MANLTIEIPDDLAVSLEGIAASQQRSVQQFAVERLRLLVAESGGHPAGSAASLIAAVRGLPRLREGDVAELEDAIREGRLPVKTRGLFCE
jgi:hypothetical protein